MAVSIPECPTPRSVEPILNDAYTFLMASPSAIDVTTADLIESLAIELSEQRECIVSLKEILSATLDQLQTQNRTIDRLREYNTALNEALRRAVGDSAT